MEPLVYRMKVTAARPEICGCRANASVNGEFWNIEEFEIRARLIMESKEELFRTISQWDQETTPEEASLDLACLGEVRFFPVEWGRE